MITYITILNNNFSYNISCNSSVQLIMQLFVHLFMQLVHAIANSILRVSFLCRNSSDIKFVSLTVNRVIPDAINLLLILLYTFCIYLYHISILLLLKILLFHPAFSFVFFSYLLIFSCVF